MTGSEARILIAEDSAIQAETLRRTLAAGGYAVYVAKNGAAGLAMARELKPDLVISDIVMPEMNGIALCRHIKNDPQIGPTPVILLTSLADPSDVISGLECGANNFIVKPYDKDQLLSRVRHLLLDRELPAEEEPQQGVEINFAGKKYCITSGKKQILGLLISTYESAVQKTAELTTVQEELILVNDKLEASIESFSNIVEKTRDGIIVINGDGRIKYYNEAAKLMLNRGEEELLEAPCGFPISVNATIEIDILSNAKEEGVAELRCMETNWNGSPAMLVSMRDVTENIRLREELRNLAYYDELTAVYNRRAFFALANQQIKISDRSGDGENEKPMLVMFIDLDNMKHINDKFGHQEGDAVLIDTATVLRQTFRESDIIARTGGDEFAVMAIQGGEEGALRERLQRNVERLNREKAGPYILSLSTGVARYDPVNPCTLDDLLAKADENMYAEKLSKHALQGTGSR
jgi:two-component system, cell cycle response regulator